MAASRTRPRPPVTNVTVSIALFDSAGKPLQTATFPADCIVLDGLASTSFRARSFDPAAAARMRSITVSASGVPTVRRPVLIPARIDSRSDFNQFDFWDREYAGTVTNDQPYDVTATIVYGQEWQTGAIGLSFLDAFRDDSASGRRLAPGESATFGFWCENFYGRVAATATVLAEAVPATTPGIAMETTRVLCAYGVPVAIRGTVRDNGGVTGVPQATVVYRTSANGTTWSRPATVTAGPSGTFSVTASPKALTFTPSRSAAGRVWRHRHSPRPWRTTRAWSSPRLPDSARYLLASASGSRAPCRRGIPPGRW